MILEELVRMMIFLHVLHISLSPITYDISCLLLNPTANMSIVALGHGIYHHYFYGWMDRKFPVNSLRFVSYKILLDQVIASPACMWIFFIGMALLEGRDYESGWQEMKKKFLFCYMVSNYVSLFGLFLCYIILGSEIDFPFLLRLTGLCGPRTSS